MKLLTTTVIATMMAPMAFAGETVNARVKDHYATVYEHIPVTKRYCENVEVPVYGTRQKNGNAAEGAILGMIIGGLAGKAVTGKDNGAAAGAAFDNLLSNPGRLIMWQTLFMALCVIVVIGGVKRGLGIAVETLMPLLFLMMLMLLVFAFLKGNFEAAVNFLFSFNLDALTWRGVLEAMGQAFFTLSIGMGAIMAYGAYMPQDANIGKTILIVAFFDSAVAIISGLIIFSIVFATPGIQPSAGPGLMFISLPVAFGSMPGGLLIGAVFFVLVSIAAWSSAISLLEPCVAWLMEAKSISRAKANLVIAGTAWVLGLGSVFSFNIWSEYKVAGFTYFDFLDFLTANIMLPISGLLITLFVGYVIKREVIDFEMQGTSDKVMEVWQFTIRYIAPFAISLVFIMGVYDKFFA